MRCTENLAKYTSASKLGRLKDMSRDGVRILFPSKSLLHLSLEFILEQMYQWESSFRDISCYRFLKRTPCARLDLRIVLDEIEETRDWFRRKFIRV